MSSNKVAPGIHGDPGRGMNPTGNINGDMSVSGIIPGGETCEGWSILRIDKPYVQASKACGHLAPCLPVILRQQHGHIRRGDPHHRRSWPGPVDRRRGELG